MADQTDFSKPDVTSRYDNEVYETLRANIRAALSWLPGSRANPGTGAVRRSTPAAGELLLETSNDATGSAWSTLFDSRTKVNKAGDTMTGALVLNAASNTRIEVQNSGDLNRGGYLSDTGSAFRVGSQSAVRPIEIAPDSTTAATFAVGGKIAFGGATGLGSSLSKLSVYGFAIFGNSSAPQVLIGDAGSGYGIGGTYSNHDYTLRANNTDLLTVKASGVVQLESGAGALRMVATAPYIEHQLSGSAISRHEFSASGGRGRSAISTYDTAGLNLRYQFVADSGQTFISYGSSSGVGGGYVVCTVADVVIGILSGDSVQLGSGAFRPQTDNAVTSGKNGNRWSAVWAANGTIQTSDLTDKTDIARIDGALAARFVQGLNPIMYRWIVGGQKVEQIEDGYDEQEIEVEEKYLEDVQEPVTEEVEVDHIEEQLELVGGQAVRRLVPVKKKEQRPVGTWVPVVDENGAPVMRHTGTRERTVGRGLLKRKVFDPIMEPVQHFVPTMRTVQVERTRTTTRIERKPRYKTLTTEIPGKRMHAGFGAQDIKALMDKLGIDCGLWVLDEQGKQHMRPDQLIPFLAAALASALDRLDKLEGGSSSAATK